MNHNASICAEIENHLPLFVGGDLEDAAATSVALHLATCPACTEREHEARVARELLVSALQLSERQGPELWPGVRAGLVREGVLSAEPRSLHRPAWRKPYLVYAAAAAAVLVGFWLGRDAFDTGGPYGPDTHTTPPIVAENLPAPELHAPIVPVANTSPNVEGLRLVGSNEARLRDTAVIYGALPYSQGLIGPRDPNMPAPVNQLEGPRRR